MATITVVIGVFSFCIAMGMALQIDASIYGIIPFSLPFLLFSIYSVLPRKKIFFSLCVTFLILGATYIYAPHALCAMSILVLADIFACNKNIGTQDWYAITFSRIIGSFFYAISYSPSWHAWILHPSLW